MSLGPTELLVVLAILAVGVVSYGIPIWAIVDAAGRPESAYAAIGANKTTQIVVLVVTALLCGLLGLIVAAFYLIGTRRELASATAP